ncbi:Ubiquitin carboxyl-terminal hydrolase 30 [Rhizopus stolonifer]|uniref:Ubiquitin carboxyl-terminal hydrolase n=1 Tax=Rhizopus stolonifer TaxID=4846 RepID=A0A367K7K0_RHIST|nr:Ubiquitin carboxyl-terminal hydrolase 30 [Rhizopus stolonifer]
MDENISFKDSPKLAQVSPEMVIIQHDNQTCLFPAHASLRLAGLSNIGNSCYLNSILQALSSLTRLHSYLDKVSKHSLWSNLPVTRLLLQTLRLLSVPSEQSFAPNELIYALQKSSFVLNAQQQDAQELLQFIQEDLENESKKALDLQGLLDILHPNKATFDPELEYPIQAYFQKTLGCTVCGYSSSANIELYKSIPLTVPKGLNSTTLNACLTDFLKNESFHGLECEKCSMEHHINQLKQTYTDREKITTLEQKLAMNIIDQDEYRHVKDKVYVEKTKTISFFKPPKILCFQIVCSSFSQDQGAVKRPLSIQFPSILDLSPFGQLKKYQLMALVAHEGRQHQSGHYLTFKRRIVARQCNCKQCGQDKSSFEPHDHDWFKVSDTLVEPCHVQKVLRQNPYMLFYQVVEDIPIQSLFDSIKTNIQTFLFMKSAVKKMQTQNYLAQCKIPKPEDCHPSIPILGQ